VKAEVKAQWVKDLRSGDYEQGSTTLRRAGTEGGQDQFCCLGVLCEQAVRAGVIPAPELHAGTYRYLNDIVDDGGKVTGESFNEECSLPRKVAEWAGVFHPDGKPREDVIIEPGDDCRFDMSAIEANDGVGLPFSEIADLIDRNVPAE